MPKKVSKNDKLDYDADAFKDKINVDTEDVESEDSKNIRRAINKYLFTARRFIYDKLIGDFKLDTKKAVSVEKIIHDSVRIAMINKFGHKENSSVEFFWGCVQEDGKKNREMFDNHRDFYSWAWTALTVPFYQSLGDTIGFYNGKFEFNDGNPNAGPEYVVEMLYKFIDLGGINDISITNLLASDDTILYMATMDVLSHTSSRFDIQIIANDFRVAYIDALELMDNRYPGDTTVSSLKTQKHIKWDALEYESKATGNGSAMRTGCIGIFFPGKVNRTKLMKLAVENSRITHNSAIAILGSVTSALFTALALEKNPVSTWPHKLIKFLKSETLESYMKTSRPKEYPMYFRDKDLYIGRWENYIRFRFLGKNPKLDIRYMKNLTERYSYLVKNFSKGYEQVGGWHADDAVIMAYDAVLQSEGSIEKVVIYSILHPGDSDTVGSLALSWYGGYYHSMSREQTLGRLFEELEFGAKLRELLCKNVANMARSYYYDIYIDMAYKKIDTIRKDQKELLKPPRVSL